MANKNLSDGVGKKIVEALKKQSEIEINPIPVQQEQEVEANILDEIAEQTEEENIGTETEESESFLDEESLDSLESNIEAEEDVPAAAKQFVNYSQLPNPSQDTFIKDLDSFEIPSNIAVLKKLITQLPSGVTRHTGAQIIKQTMEALGISMKSVLQEAQQVQEGLNTSVTECHSNIQEYKKQIVLLEKQAQNYQRQYSALNELISLFVQTGL